MGSPTPQRSNPVAYFVAGDGRLARVGRRRPAHDKTADGRRRHRRGLGRRRRFIRVDHRQRHPHRVRQPGGIRNLDRQAVGGRATLEVEGCAAGRRQQAGGIHGEGCSVRPLQAPGDVVEVPVVGEEVVDIPGVFRHGQGLIGQFHYGVELGDHRRLIPDGRCRAAGRPRSGSFEVFGPHLHRVLGCRRQIVDDGQSHRFRGSGLPVISFVAEGGGGAVPQVVEPNLRTSGVVRLVPLDVQRGRGSSRGHRRRGRRQGRLVLVLDPKAHLRRVGELAVADRHVEDVSELIRLVVQDLALRRRKGAVGVYAEGILVLPSQAPGKSIVVAVRCSEGVDFDAVLVDMQLDPIVQFVPVDDRRGVGRRGVGRRDAHGVALAVLQGPAATVPDARGGAVLLVPVGEIHGCGAQVQDELVQVTDFAGRRLH